MKNTVRLLALMTILVSAVGCTALKSLVKNIETSLNSVLDGAHGTVTNAAETVIAPLK